MIYVKPFSLRLASYRQSRCDFLACISQFAHGKHGGCSPSPGQAGGGACKGFPSGQLSSEHRLAREQRHHPKSLRELWAKERSLWLQELEQDAFTRNWIWISCFYEHIAISSVLAWEIPAPPAKSASSVYCLFSPALLGVIHKIQYLQSCFSVNISFNYFFHKNICEETFVGNFTGYAPFFLLLCVYVCV